jgi:hypothetical protein
MKNPFHRYNSLFLVVQKLQFLNNFLIKSSFAGLSDFSPRPKNCKTCETTDRVVEQVHYFIGSKAELTGNFQANLFVS